MTTAKQAIENISIKDIPAILPMLSLPEQEKLLAELDKLEELRTKQQAQDKFIPFVKQVWPTFISGRHHAKMASAFERVAAGKSKRLIINMPPRHTKSEFASYLLPAWFLGKFPQERYVTLSIRKSIASYFRGLAYNQTQKRLVGGRLTVVETISLLVWEVLSLVKVRISSLLTTPTRSKRRH
jgi:hypothetical protein